MSDLAARVLSPIGWLLTGMLRLWQWFGQFRQPRCRFHPTCSEYAIESIQVHGVVSGSAQAVARIARCHPWNPGGVDPVKAPSNTI